MGGGVKLFSQIPSVPRIQKLLEHASKSGSGRGYPDFTLVYPSFSDLLVVIECKPNKNKHSSPQKNKFKDYAVDGSLLYSDYLSKEYDVISIGVSGMEDPLKVSTFLQMKGSRPVDIRRDNLLKAIEYPDIYLKSEIKKSQDYSALKKYAVELNELLHRNKIKENNRSLLISGILIALNDRAFNASYREHPNAKELADNLVVVISKNIAKATLKGKGQDSVINSYQFIKGDTSLTQNKDLLLELIDGINQNINKVLETHKYHDVVSDFYVEFLRYANNDKGLGIVLTPPHITDLFMEFLNIDQKDVLLDSCSGTGGFLVSGLRKMMKGNLTQNEMTKIKKNNLVGIEYQSDIFTLCVANMIIHNDGKSNIYKGNCFHDNLVEEIKSKYKPTKGALNPPYSMKKKDKNELEFVLQNLKFLLKGGLCVAIIPTSCLTETSSKTRELKRQLMEEHTILACITMPDEIFYNSNVSVNTAVLVIKAHSPHGNQNSPIWLARLKDDGFIKRKPYGRIDHHGKWADIKKDIMKIYINRKQKTGISILKERLSPQDEWVAEAYVKTDYSSLDNDFFERKLREYVSYLFKYKKISKALADRVNNGNIELGVSKWKYHYINDLYRVSTAKGGNIQDLQGEYTDKDSVPYVSASEQNNGVTTYKCAENEEQVEKTCTLSVSRTGSVSEIFYHPYSYMASADSIRILEAKKNITALTNLFIAAVLSLEKFRYCYGRTFGTNRINQTRIKLPTLKDGSPDFKFMDTYMKTLSYSKSAMFYKKST